MCIIIHTARKSLLRRSEVQEAMKNNNSGFFISELLGHGKRNTIRTLSSTEAQDFWDAIPETSEVVMHFRIPSKGGVTIGNVHGWESDGILFAHNRTLHNLSECMDDDKWEHTDSEYFFRRIFLPVYRQYGKKAFRHGRLNPDIDHMIRGICGDYNKFVFVMPNNTVLRYGEWEGDDPCREGLHASNMSYVERTDSSVKLSLIDRIRSFFSK